MKIQLNTPCPYTQRRSWDTLRDSVSVGFTNVGFLTIQTVDDHMYWYPTSNIIALHDDEAAKSLASRKVEAAMKELNAVVNPPSKKKGR